LKVHWSESVDTDSYQYNLRMLVSNLRCNYAIMSLRLNTLKHTCTRNKTPSDHF